MLRPKRWLGRTEFRPKDYTRALVNGDGNGQRERNGARLRAHAVVRPKGA